MRAYLDLGLQVHASLDPLKDRGASRERFYISDAICFKQAYIFYKPLLLLIVFCCTKYRYPKMHLHLKSTPYPKHNVTRIRLVFKVHAVMGTRNVTVSVAGLLFYLWQQLAHDVA